MGRPGWGDEWEVTVKKVRWGTDCDIHGGEAHLL